MVDAKEMKLKKVPVTEEDVCTLLQRYTATTVLALLREVAQVAELKIDWQALVENTKTGIKTAREYQMLWRHLAYRKPLLECVDASDQPLDDDSDLEYELEPSPPVSNEAIIEASNCVKVLASGSASESSIPISSSVEDRALNVNSSNVTSENPLVAGTISEGLDANGLAINRKRRKPWSEEEDLELIAAVQKYGEGSWAAILKGDFKGNRSASQLAQRWNIIRRKHVMLNIGGGKRASPQLTQAQLATRHALDMALKDNLSTGCGTVGNETAGTNTPKISVSKLDLPVIGATVPPSQPQSSPVTCPTSSVKPAPVASMSKVRPQKKGQLSVCADSIQAAAVAAGARIASPSDAASLFKAAQSKNAVRIRGGASLIKTSTVGSSSPLPPNVHFIRTGLASTPISMASAGTASLVAGQQAKGSAVRPPVPPALVSQFPKARTTPAVGMELINAAQQMENIVNVQGSDDQNMTEVLENNVSHPQSMPKASLDKCQATAPTVDVGCSKQMANVGNSECAVKNDLIDDACKQILESPVLKLDNEKPTVDQTLQSCTAGVNEAQEVPLTVIVDVSAEKMEISSEELPGVKSCEQTNL